MCVYIYNFIYFLLFWAFPAVWSFLQLWRLGVTLELWCAGFSLPWLLLLQSTGSRACGLSRSSSWAPEHRLNSFGART